MGIFGKIFGSKKPTPSYEIHPEDQALIKDEDSNWWKSISLDDLKKLEKQDNITRMTMYSYLKDEQGLSDDDALNEVKKSVPMYYLTLEQRASKPFMDGDDAKLPYILKNRINHSIVPRLTKESLDLTSSSHSLIRQLLIADEL